MIELHSAFTVHIYHSSVPLLSSIQVVLQLEKKLFSYVNQDVFRENNGTSVSLAFVSEHFKHLMSSHINLFFYKLLFFTFRSLIQKLYILWPGKTTCLLRFELRKINMITF